MFAIDQSRTRGHDFRQEVRALETNQIVKATAFADRACPVLFRDSSFRQILAFRHPLAGLQLVKGIIEPGETAREAALRELREESGIEDSAIAQDLGTWHSDHKGHVWSLQLCTFKPKLPEAWTHHCADDGGFDFKFFWHNVHDTPGDDWAPQYQRALAAIQERTRALRWRG
jgi:8-oxo-dGTP pyrophosphatase MutT (NUDIX family)